MRVMKTLMLLCVVGTLFASGCMSPVSPLFKAAERNDTNTVKELLNKGADINERNGPAGLTSLMRASGAGHVDLVKFLLDKGADVNCTGGRMLTALSIAAANGQTEVARILMTRNADVRKALVYLNNGASGPFEGHRNACNDGIELINKLKKELNTTGQGLGESGAQPAVPPPPKDLSAPF